MTRYQIFWPEDVLNELAQIWVSYPDRAAVASASNLADVILSTAPSQFGDDVSEGLLSLSIEPLHILFAVSEMDKRVEVAAVFLMQHE
ncbi:MAG: hypothetical protein HY000_32730 [Planctomycetes bacterium]|nr:hypothetical protein [Planctomycetota bacterium]